MARSSINTIADIQAKAKEIDNNVSLPSSMSMVFILMILQTIDCLSNNKSFVYCLILRIL